MKLKKYLTYAVAFLAVFASSCGQLDEPLPVESDASDLSVVPRITATLSIQEELRALEFDLDGEKLTLTDNPENFDTHAYFYNPTHNLLGYARLAWDAEAQGNGSYKLTLLDADKLKVKIIDGGNGYRQVRPRDGWYVTGISGGGVLSSDSRNISFPDNIDQPKGRILAPLSFPWTSYDKDELGVHFRPLGVIIRPIVANETQMPLKGVSHIESNGLSNKGTFEVSTAIAKRDIVDRKYLPWVFEWDKQGKPAPALSRTPFSVSQPAKSIHPYLTWGMVYVSPTQHYKVRVTDSENQYYLRKATGTVFDEQLNLVNGSNYIFDLLLKVDKPITPPITPPDVHINQSKNLVGCWMQGNLKASGLMGVYPGLLRPRMRSGVWIDEGHARSVSHDDNSYFSWTGMSVLLGRSQPVLEKFRGAYLPSAYEFAQLFPNPTSNVKCLNFGARSGSREIQVKERVAFGDGHYGSPREYQAIYKSTGSRIVYALRHIGHGNGYRSAFRYELERDVTGAGLVVKVQVYYLGAAGEFTMEQIGDEAWWTRRHRDVKTIYFSNPGYADLSGSSYLGSSPGYGGDPRYGGYMGRFGRRGLLRPGGYRQPTILEQGRTAYYWSSTNNGTYGLKFVSQGPGYYGSDESVFIQVGHIGHNQPYHGHVVRLKRNC
ncbi:MAG: hypothetical protein Q4A61_06830 [Porphyromonadaceae bacterium]|nr:hypothetical protein [Porphyromonadaceae bacterium]